MTSSLSDLVQSLLALDEIRPLLNKLDIGANEGALAGLFLSLMFFLAETSRELRVIRGDGWHHLTPGPLVWVTLIGTALISLGTFAGGSIAIERGYYTPSLDQKSIGSVGLFTFFILGFGAMAVACYVAYFHHKIRWNDNCIEKDTLRGTRRIAWSDVEEFRLDQGADLLWIIARDARLKVSMYMNGVQDLLAVLNRRVEA